MLQPIIQIEDRQTKTFYDIEDVAPPINQSKWVWGILGRG